MEGKTINDAKKKLEKVCALGHRKKTPTHCKFTLSGHQVYKPTLFANWKLYIPFQTLNMVCSGVSTDPDPHIQPDPSSPLSLHLYSSL